MHNDFVYLVEKQTQLFLEHFNSIPQPIVEAYVKEFENNPEKADQVKTARCFLAAKNSAMAK